MGGAATTAGKESDRDEDLYFKLDRSLHMAYFAHCLRQLPRPYDKLDTSRLTLVHFCVHALDLLQVWDDVSAVQALKLDPSVLIEWIYSLQITTLQNTDPAYIGFLGGTFIGFTAASEEKAEPHHSFLYNHGHIAMTYTALATLRALGDDWSRVDKVGIVRALPSLQLPNGSFRCIAVGSEHDMRFLYCACSISHMLQDWSGVDVDRAVSYIQACRSYDGGFALIPGQEGHGGSTFCAVASLVLMNRLDVLLPSGDDNNNTPTATTRRSSTADWRKDLIRWCVNRQVCGMQGRPNKDEDTCYSYWIGGTLKLLLAQDDTLLNHTKLRSFVLQCQTPMGGFGKYIGGHPDILHSFYSLAYLSLSQTHDNTCEVGCDSAHMMKDLNCTLGICNDRAATFGPLFP